MSVKIGPGQATTLVEGPDGPVLICALDPSGKVPWLALRTYEKRDGAGSFISFQVQDLAGTWYDAVLLNGGFWLATAGKPAGDLDIVTYDGKGGQFTVAVAGAGNGDDAGLFCWPPQGAEIGGPLTRFQEAPPRPGMPPEVTRCVKVNGGYVPIYD
jgi:hypothetical protein